MKIIGKTNGGFIIEANEYELARMNGCAGLYSQEWKNLQGRDGLIGKSIDINALATKVSQIKSAQPKINDAINTFRNLADALEKSWPLFEKIEDASHE